MLTETLNTVGNLSWKRIISNIILSILIGLTVIMIYGLALLLQRTPPVDDINSRVITADVNRLGSLEIDYSFKRYKSCPVTVERNIRDYIQQDFTLSQQDATVNFSDPEHLRLSVVVPREAAPGPAIFYLKLYYNCNWAQKFFRLPIYIHMNPEQFNINSEIETYVKPPMKAAF